MHRIGIISDTHGLIRPEVAEVLHGCEMILHCGDVNKQKVLDELEMIAPVYVVRGNNDKEWAEDIPESLTLEIFGLKIFMVHAEKSIPENLFGVDLILCGHSHKYEEKRRGYSAFLNPGSCGPKRFRQEITMAVLSVEDGGEFFIEKIVIPYMTQDKEIPENLAGKILAVTKAIDAGQPVKKIAAKYKIPEELSEQICRMYLTHPGIDVDGILKRLGL